jgi:hypothetical protein
LGFNPYGQAVVPDGCFFGPGIFRVIPAVMLKYLEEIFKQNERMTYLPDETRVLYRSKGNRQEKALNALGQLV